MTLDAKRGLVFVPTGSAAVGFLRRQSSRRQPLRQLPARARCRHRQTALAFPVRETRRARSRPAHGADAGDAALEGQDGRCAGADRPSRVSCSCSIAIPASRCFPWRKCRRPLRTFRARSRTRPICARRSPAPYARQRLTADDSDPAHAGGQRVGARRSSRRCAATGHSSRSASASTRLSTRASTAAPNGAARPSTPRRGLLYVNANEMAWLGSLAPNDKGRSTGKSIYLRDCAACHGDSGQGSPPQFPSLVGHRRAHDRRNSSPNACARAAAACRPSRTCRRRRCSAIGTVPRGRRGHSRRRTRYLARQPGLSLHRLSALAAIREGYPAVAMPWGTLNAIELATGKYVVAHPFRRIPRTRGARHQATPAARTTAARW